MVVCIASQVHPQVTILTSAKIMSWMMWLRSLMLKALTYHYVPLHSSPSGLKYGSFFGNDAYTTKISNRIIRLPLYESMTLNQLDRVTHAVEVFFLIGLVIILRADRSFVLDNFYRDL